MYNVLTDLTPSDAKKENIKHTASSYILNGLSSYNEVEGFIQFLKYVLLYSKVPIRLYMFHKHFY